MAGDHSRLGDRRRRFQRPHVKGTLVVFATRSTRNGCYTLTNVTQIATFSTGNSPLPGRHDAAQDIRGSLQGDATVLPRQRPAVRGCADPGGVEAGGEATPFDVGTVARINQLGAPSRGSLPITVVGEQRFRISKLDRSKSYLMGEIEVLKEDDGSAVDKAVLGQANFGGAAVSFDHAGGPGSVAFGYAHPRRRPGPVLLHRDSCEFCARTIASTAAGSRHNRSASSGRDRSAGRRDQANSGLDHARRTGQR